MVVASGCSVGNRSVDYLRHLAAPNGEASQSVMAAVCYTAEPGQPGLEGSTPSLSAYSRRLEENRRRDMAKSVGSSPTEGTSMMGLVVLTCSEDEVERIMMARQQFMSRERWVVTATDQLPQVFFNAKRASEVAAGIKGDPKLSVTKQVLDEEDKWVSA